MFLGRLLSHLPPKKKESFLTVFKLAFVFLSFVLSLAAFSKLAFAQTSTTLDVQVSFSSDDAYHAPSGWPNYNSTSSVMYAGKPSGNLIYGGWRWTDLSIPSGAAITAAYVEFKQKNWGHVFATNLAFENSASPATFSSSSSPFHRWSNKTTFQLQWTWLKDKPNAWIRTPDLGAGIQELVNAHGAIGQIVLIEDGTPAPSGNYHEWQSFDGGGSGASAAKLHIEYTSGPDVTQPLLSNGQPTGTLPAGTTQTQISLTTNENATCRYDTVAGTAYSAMPNTFATTGGVSHSTTVTGLVDGSTNSYYARCQDASGNANTNDFPISFSIEVPDTTAPVISSIASSPGGTSALITWQTNEAASSQVEYGTTTALGTFTTLDSNLVTSHSVTISGLTAATTYFYQVRSSDESDNASVEPISPASFTTASGQVVYPGATWDTRTPVQVNLDDAKLNEFITTTNSTQGVIVRDGYVVKSWGCQTCKFNWASASKPVVATLLFYAIQEGKLTSVDNLIKDQGWALTPSDQSMTFRHLANMMSGYARAENPGEAWAYNDYGISLYKKTVFEKVYGTTNGDSVASDPSRLGVLQFQDGSIFSSGIGDSGYALFTTPRDAARIGWFWLNQGNWNNAPHLSQSFFANYALPQVPGTLPRTTASDTDYLGVGTDGGGSDQTALGPGVYGFNWWWNGEVGTTGILAWPDAPIDSYQANGHWNGEVIAVIPSLNMVATWKAPSGDPNNFAAPMNSYLKILKDAVVVPDTTAPTAPSGLNAIANGQNIDLSWIASSDPESGVASYRIYRDTVSGGAKTLLAEIPGTQLIDSSGAPSTTYFYEVSAVNGSGLESSRSNEVSATTENDAPAAPTGLSAVGGDQIVTLDWNVNGEADLAGYNVYSSTTAGGPYTKINSSLLVTPSFNNTGLTNGQTYYYVVTAVDTGSNESANSAEVSGTPSDLPVVLNTQISLGSDDAYHALGGWPGFSNSSANIYAGKPSSKITYGGWRWTGLNIPDNATISNAYVEFRQKGWGGSFPTNLAFENSKTPATFSSGFSPSDRWANKTTFQVTWSWLNSVPDTWIQSPDLTAGIQELVNTHGTINEIVLIEDGTPADSYHEWHGFEGGSGAKLHIEYTAGPDLAAPLLNNGQPSGNLQSGTTQATLSLNTDENATCKYATVAGTAYAAMTNVFATTGTTSHSTLVSGLTDGNTYSYYVRCIDEAGNANSIDFIISFGVAVPDSNPPFRQNGQPTGNLPVGTTQTVISLVTDEAATCRYDTTVGEEYGLMANAFTTTGGTSHSSTVTGLVGGQTYNYYVKCQDVSGNTNPDDFLITFSILSSGDPTAPVISGVTVHKGLDSVVVEWKTDDFSSSQVFYGTTPSLGQQTALDATQITSHAVFIGALSPQTTYYFSMESTNADGLTTSTVATPVSETTVSSSDLPNGVFPFPNWPAKIDLAVGESAVHTLRDGTTRTLKLVGYTATSRHDVKATIEVANGTDVKTHTLHVAFDAVPVAVNGLWVYGYAWKEADDLGYEQVGVTGSFPLTTGKDVGFAVNDALYSLFPNPERYSYPGDIAFHEGPNIIQSWLEPAGENDDAVAHAGYDLKTPADKFLRAVADGWAWFQLPSDPSLEGQAWISASQNCEWCDNANWLWAHVKGASALVPKGTYVTAGTPIALGGRHFGSRNTFDFGSMLFTAEIWNNEHKTDFPVPRHWLILGPYTYSGVLANDNHVAVSESGSISANPQEGVLDKDGIKQWQFRDNFANGVVHMGELVSSLPFSGNLADSNPANSMAYAATYVYSPVSQQVHLKWGSNNEAKVWLNGQSVLDQGTGGPLVIDQVDAPITLQAGWNTLIAKTSVTGGAWRFSAKIGDVSGNNVPGLVFSTRKIQLSQTGGTTNSIDLSWTAPNYHGTFVDSYKIDVATDLAFSNLVLNNVDIGSATIYTMSNLNPGTVYYIRVKPFNASELGGSVYDEYVDVLVASTVDEIPPSLTAPGGLTPAQTPIVVTLGMDDNSASPDWIQQMLGARQHADATPLHMSFYWIGLNVSPRASEIVSLYNDGHEIGNHDQTLTGDKTLADWLTTIKQADDLLAGLGLPQGIMPDGRAARIGYRAPQDAYNDAMHTALTQLGYKYGSSIADGWSMTRVDVSNPPLGVRYDGTNAIFPHTIEGGDPVADFNDRANIYNRPIASHSGNWEMYEHRMIVPDGRFGFPDIKALRGDIMLGHCDDDWYSSDLTTEEVKQTLLFNIELRKQGNHAPLHLCIHDYNYDEVGTNPAAETAHRQMLTEFVDLALTNYPEVRFWSNAQLLNWMRNPIPLSVTP
ncbi:fibronectin type III domain-containing protein [Candidatus Roizmanbacteria bacterium]|nr:fibronectin type III domain-containing protein [Candidatus Roizmanbacteria bacterium]